MGESQVVALVDVHGKHNGQILDVAGVCVNRIGMHGSLANGANWAIDGYLDDLKEDYSLILIDARGHGKSDKPHDSDEYTGPKFAKDVVAVLDDLGLDQAIYWGYSLGAHVGYELANAAPDRISAFIIGGGTPYAEDMRFPVDGDENDQATVRTAMLSRLGMTVESIPDLYKDLILSNDFIAVRAAMRDRPSVEAALEKMTMPCLIYVGDQDPRLGPSEKAVAQMPNAKLVVLPGLNHVGAMMMKDMVMPKVKEFLETLA